MHTVRAKRVASDANVWRIVFPQTTRCRRPGGKRTCATVSFQVQHSVAAARSRASAAHPVPTPHHRAGRFTQARSSATRRSATTPVDPLRPPAVPWLTHEQATTRGTTAAACLHDMLDHTQTPDRRLFALQKGVFLFSNLKQFSGVQIAVSDRALRMNVNHT